MTLKRSILEEPAAVVELTEELNLKWNVMIEWVQLKTVDSHKLL